MIQQLYMGLLFSGIISGLAYWRRSLSFNGGMAAIVVGTTLYALGSLYWFGILLAFFISSSFLSHFKKGRKKKVEDLFSKTGRRDAIQVLANGGFSVILVVIAYAEATPSPYMAIFLGMIATVNADTWGTELGVLSKGLPRHILSWKKVEKGTSGGISTLGTIGTASGACFIGFCGAAFLWVEGYPFNAMWILLAVISGTFGALMDSVLGATLQSMFYCSQCRQQTEKREHCKYPTKKIRGYTWFTNDMVNALSSLLGGGAAWILWQII